MSEREHERLFDELLVVSAQAGDRDAAARLAARWAPRLMRTARRILRDDDLAQDAVQDAWAGIARGLAGLSDPTLFPAWAFGILHRKCADTLRRRIGDRNRTSPLDEAAPPSVDEQSELRIALVQAFAALGDDQRIAATLFFGEGLSLVEIAAATGVPIGTVKSRLFYARRQLKAALSGD